MFKNLILYRIDAAWSASLQALEQALARQPFAPCSATQEQSGGWVAPRGQAHGALVESVGGQWVMRYKSESKMLPASVLARRVQELAQRIEQESGRKPGKKELRDLKDQAKQDLLPRAFTKDSSTWLWLDPQAHLLALDTSAQSHADAITTELTELLPGFALSLLDTRTSPATAMALWLKEQQAPSGFAIDRECELKSADESKAVVRYARHPLDIEEVRQHIDAGKLPTRLALTWGERLGFLLTESLQLRKLAFLDTVLEGQSSQEEGFDADVALATGELAGLIPDLIAALDGEGRSASPHSAGSQEAAAEPAQASTPTANDDDPPF